MREILMIIAILFAVFVGYLFQADRVPRFQAPSIAEGAAVGNKIGNQSPQLELLDLEGQTVQLTDHRGKIVIVNFWATWCPPCRSEMPDMQRFYEDYAEHVVVLGVNITKAEASIQDVRSFAEKIGITFPVLLDEDGNAINAYRVAAYPATFVLDGKGIIREVYRGQINYDKLQQAMIAIQSSSS